MSAKDTPAPDVYKRQALTTGAASAHYLIPAPHDPSYKAAGFKGQRIFNLVAEEDRAWHAGVSGWARRDNLNDTSIGIEIVNLARDDDGVFTFPDYELSLIHIFALRRRSAVARRGAGAAALKGAPPIRASGAVRSSVYAGGRACLLYTSNASLVYAFPSSRCARREFRGHL